MQYITIKELKGLVTREEFENFCKVLTSSGLIDEGDVLGDDRIVSMFAALVLSTGDCFVAMQNCKKAPELNSWWSAFTNTLLNEVGITLKEEDLTEETLISAFEGLGVPTPRGTPLLSGIRSYNYSIPGDRVIIAAITTSLYRVLVDCKERKDWDYDRVTSLRLLQFKEVTLKFMNVIKEIHSNNLEDSLRHVLSGIQVEKFGDKFLL